MLKHQLFVATATAALTALLVAAGLWWAIGGPGSPAPAIAQSTGNFQYVSVSAMDFLPVQQNGTFIKDTQRQMLSLTGLNRSISLNRNTFVAPLTLPDGSELVAMTVFGEDFDNQGEVRVRLKRCDHSQARCLNLGETSSTASFAAGRFETTRVVLQNELANNGFYSYFLELELTALSNSGLRSIRIEVRESDGTSGVVERWSLSGNITGFPLPNTGLTQVKICTDDLSYLDNATHYPLVVADNRTIQLGSNACETVWGRNIEVRRRANTGSSSGTYQFLR